MKTSLLRVLPAFALAFAASTARADEGMWTFDRFPSDKVQKAHGFAPDKAWLDHVRLSSAKLGMGCSSSFVSPNGLVMTNHHCVRGCIEDLTTPKRNVLHQGFVAKTQAQELVCPNLDVMVLEEITDVTARVNEATKGLKDAAFNQALKAEFTRIETECGTSRQVRCDVVTLFHGGAYHRYRYARYDDVRLAFAPEMDAVDFGGYKDNFDFPRYSIDIALLRAYRDGKPVQTAHYLKWSPNGSKEDELVFVPGHPGGTNRQLTVAQLENLRDSQLPAALVGLSETRGVLLGLGMKDPAFARKSVSMLRGVENGMEVMIGRQTALADPRFFAKKRAEEAALREKIRKEFDDWQATDAAFDKIAQALDGYRTFRLEHSLAEGRSGSLLMIAKMLVRMADEREKAPEQRLPEFAPARLARTEFMLAQPQPFQLDEEQLSLALWLARIQDFLGPDHPLAKAALERKQPSALAATLVKGTRLTDPKVRVALMKGGKAAVEASKDPLIQLARRIDPIGRELRKRYEDRVESVVKREGEVVAKAQVKAYGMNTYPDATGTLRLSYGQVKGWKEGENTFPAYTQLAGAYERHSGNEPFKLPPSWLAAKGKLALDTPYNLVTTNDIIGGNSGSPLINAAGEVVGLVFDGNVPSLGGDYYYQGETNRTVAVDSRGILEVLDKVYGATRLTGELRQK